MSRERHRNRRRCRSGRLVLIVLLSALSGSASAGGDAPAQPDSLWNRALETLNLRTKVGPMPDFVRATRPDPATLKFIPTGTPHPRRAVPAKSLLQVEAAKQALDAARDAQLNPPAAAPPPAPASVPAAAKHPLPKPKPTADQN